MHKTITFIGAGNMASSLISGLIADGYDTKAIWVTDPSLEKLKKLQQQFGMHITTNNNEGVKQAEILVLAVKPQILRQVAQEIAALAKERKPLIISIAAMIPTVHLEKWLGKELAIVRCMPNLAAIVRSSAIGMYPNANVDHTQKSLAESVLRAVGTTLWIADEKQMDVVTALSGNGPAYFFHLMEMLQQSAEQLGLPQETAKLLTLQTALGAARLALEAEIDVAALRQQVTSPGGTTEIALEVLERNNVRQHYYDALGAACKRAAEIATQLKD